MSRFGYYCIMKAESVKAKILVFACFLLFFPSILNAVDSRKVKVVQNKDVLDNADLQIIDGFVEEGIRELLEAEDFASISTVRDELIANSNSKRVSSEKQYRNQFIKSVSQYTTDAFKSSQNFIPERRFKVTVNLLMVIESLHDIQLSGLVLGRLDDSNGAVRYWAMKCFTNPEIIKQLNDGAANSALVSQIISRLNKLVDNCDDAMLTLITNFTSELQADESTQLLIKIADLRMQQYSKWQVKDEMTDTAVLKALFSKIISKQGIPETARKFAQLYSYVCQRYLKGDSLSDAHKQKLISVIVDVEDKYISKLLGKQTKIRDAVTKRDNQALASELDSLLGSADTEGRLPAKLQFTYRSSEGKDSTAPLALPAAPQ